MEKIVQITSLSVQGGVDHLVALTNYGNLYRYTPTSPPTGQGIWMPMLLPTGLTQQLMFEEINTGGRVNAGYQVWKDKEHNLFCWRRGSSQSEFYERLEGAIGGARTDFQIRHPQKPPPPKPHL